MVKHKAQFKKKNYIILRFVDFPCIWAELLFMGKSKTKSNSKDYHSSGAAKITYAWLAHFADSVVNFVCAPDEFQLTCSLYAIKLYFTWLIIGLFMLSKLHKPCKWLHRFSCAYSLNLNGFIHLCDVLSFSNCDCLVFIYHKYTHVALNMFALFLFFK